MTLGFARAVASGVLSGALLAASIGAASLTAPPVSPDSNPGGGGGSSSLIYHSGSASYGTWYSGLLDPNRSNTAQGNNAFDTVKAKNGVYTATGSPSVTQTYSTNHNTTSCEILQASKGIHPSIGCTVGK